MIFKEFLTGFSIALLSTQIVYAQEDPISDLLNEQYPVLFSEQDVSNTQPVVTLDEHKSNAEELLKKGLYKVANRHIKHLKESNEFGDYGIYLEGLLLSQQGQFEQAYNLLNKLTGFNKKYNDAARNYQAELAVNLAWIALNQQNLAEAETWLSRFNPEKSSSRLDRKKDLIEDRINMERLNQIDTEKNYGKPLKVALLLPLTGIYQNIGLNMLEAAQLALFQQPNPNILLYPHDTQSTEMGARLAAQKAISDKANIIIGPLTSNHTKAVQNYAQSAGIPILTFSSDSELSKKGVHVFGHEHTFQALTAATMVADLDITTTAILAPDTPYGYEMTQQFQNKAIDLGVSITHVAYFNPNSTDQSEQLKKLAQEELSLKLLKDERNLLEREFNIVGAAMSDASLTRLEELKTLEPQPIVNFEALYLPVTAEKLPLIASQLAFYDMDNKNVQLIGSALWHDKSVYKNKGEYIKGAYYPAPSEKLMEKLQKDFKQHYNKDLLPISSLAYDAIKLVTSAYINSDFRPNRLTDEFYAPDGYLLSNGPTKLLKNGMTERLYDMYEVRTYSHVSRTQAPLAFPPALPEPLDPNEKSSFDSFFNPWGF